MINMITIFIELCMKGDHFACKKTTPIKMYDFRSWFMYVCVFDGV